MLGYLSVDIICSSKLTVFLELRSCFSEQIMPAEKYPSIITSQMEAIVYSFNTASTDKLNNTAEHIFRVYLRDSTVI